MEYYINTNNVFKIEMPFFLLDEIFLISGLDMDNNEDYFVEYSDIFSIKLSGTQSIGEQTFTLIDFENLDGDGTGTIKVPSEAMHLLLIIIEIYEAFQLFYHRDFYNYRLFTSGDLNILLEKGPESIMIHKGGEAVDGIVITNFNDISTDNFNYDCEQLVSVIIKLMEVTE